jgi:hypothetical protein
MAFSQPRRYEGFSAGLYVPVDEVTMRPEGLMEGLPEGMPRA